MLQYNANTFADPTIGSAAATDMITKGADVIYHAAGGTGSGVIEACATNKVWAIGVDTDQSPLAPDYVVTSAMKRVDTAAAGHLPGRSERYLPGRHPCVRSGQRRR